MTSFKQSLIFLDAPHVAALLYELYSLPDLFLKWQQVEFSLFQPFEVNAGHSNYVLEKISDSRLLFSFCKRRQRGFHRL